MGLSVVVPLAVTLAIHLGRVFAVPTVNVPTVTLDQGTFQGATNSQVNKFLGIPFAQPPSVLITSEFFLTQPKIF